MPPRPAPADGSGRRRPAARRGAVLLGSLILAAAAPAAAMAAQAPEFPALSGRVVDAADVLDAATERTLTAELAAFEQASGGTQVVVATVPSLEGRAIEEYGYQLGRHWGIGQADADTGALLIVAPAERQVRIEVGYGLEGRLTDAVSWDIIQGRILPAFRAGDIDAGVLAGTRAMLAALDGSYQPTAAAPADGAPAEQRRRLPAIAFWIFVAFIILSSFGRRRRRGLASALLIGGMLGGGRGGGGGFGGGGFSGGGGSFGGGGASGGW